MPLIHDLMITLLMMMVCSSTRIGYMFLIVKVYGKWFFTRCIALHFQGTQGKQDDG